MTGFLLGLFCSCFLFGSVNAFASGRELVVAGYVRENTDCIVADIVRLISSKLGNGVEEFHDDLKAESLDLFTGNYVLYPGEFISGQAIWESVETMVVYSYLVGRHSPKILRSDGMASVCEVLVQVAAELNAKNYNEDDYAAVFSTVDRYVRDGGSSKIAKKIAKSPGLKSIVLPKGASSSEAILSSVLMQLKGNATLWNGEILPKISSEMAMKICRAKKKLRPSRSRKNFARGWRRWRW